MSLLPRIRTSQKVQLLSIVALVAGTSLVTLAQSGSRPPQHPLELVDGHEAAGGEVLVRIEPGLPPAALAGLERAADAAVSRGVGGAGWRVIRSRSRSTRALLGELRGRAGVLGVEPNHVVRLEATPNDPYWPQQWALRNTGQSVNGGPAGSPGADIGATAAWDVSTGSRSIVVGLTDTGVQYTHPDLASNLWSAPEPFTVTIGGRSITCPAGSHGFTAVPGGWSCDPFDRTSPHHGTRVAGVVGARGHNSRGVAGVNWTTTLLALKFFDESNLGYTADAIDVIEFAIQVRQRFGSAANVRVLNASWGGAPYSQALADQIQRAGAHHMLFVAAAGNNGTNNDVTPTYPARYRLPNVISVASTSNRDQLSFYSNYGASTVDLAAPGETIATTGGSGSYVYASGTSMAAPFVSGAAALVLSVCPLSTTALKATLLNDVDQLPSLQGMTVTGGRLNVNRALRACAPAAAPDIVVHAKDVASQDVHGAWTWMPDASAAGGVALGTPATGAPTPSSAAAQPRDYVDVRFTAVAGTPYRLWLRMRASGDSGRHDSVFVQFSGAQVAGAPAYRLGTSEGLIVNLQRCQGCALGGWGWQDSSYWLRQIATVSFAKTGPQTLRIQTREDGARIDQIVLSPKTYLHAAPGPAIHDGTILAATGGGSGSSPTAGILLADAFVRAGPYASTNAGSAPELIVKHSADTQWRRETYLKFDISGVRANDTVMLRLFGRLSDTRQPSVTAAVHAVADTSWSEHGITWNNRPPAGTQVASFAVTGTTARWYDVNVTPYVQAERSAGRSAISLALRGTADTLPYAGFNAKEAGSGPQLVVSAGTISGTIQTAAEADTYVRNGPHASASYGAAPELIVKFSADAQWEREAYLKFDIREVQPGDAVALRLSGRLSDAREPSMTVRLYGAADTSWREETMTWQTRPAAGSTLLGTVVAGGTSARSYEVDLTAFVQAQRSAGRQRVTLVLRGAADSLPYVSFASRETSSGPRLVLRR